MLAQRIHQDQPTLTYGSSLDEAQAAVILLHGRGASAHSMFELAAHLPNKGIAYLMPQAANNTWYPNSGFGPFAANEPFLSSAMETVRDLLERGNAAGIPTDRIVLGGFSQGACLAAEFTARHAARYGGLLVFSGALMGPLNLVRDYDGDLAGTPVYIGGVDNDPWMTKTQFHHTADVLGQLGGQVTLNVGSGADHTIRQIDIDHAVALIDSVVA